MSASLQSTRLHLVEDKLTSNFIYIYISISAAPPPPYKLSSRLYRCSIHEPTGGVLRCFHLSTAVRERRVVVDTVEPVSKPQSATDEERWRSTDSVDNLFKCHTRKQIFFGFFFSLHLHVERPFLRSGSALLQCRTNNVKTSAEIGCLQVSHLQRSCRWKTLVLICSVVFCFFLTVRLFWLHSCFSLNKTP